MSKTAAEIRQEFLDFFRGKGHAIVPSAPVVPHDDPTLLFTNAGMNQFKDVFLGTGTRPYQRVADTQKCIRAGGKHNDLDDVGHDTYHHTFFEMLGNWSFGDYFKKEAIAWAWELLTQVWGLDKSRLHATYFGGTEATRQLGNQGGAGIPANILEPDTEARDLWLSVTDIDPAHVHAGAMKDNFWEMGETGPCGPCSEIHIDLTPDKSGIRLVNAGDPRVMEIWNLVFIQFNRAPDGKLTPLPEKHVDTGMGFERVTALLQGKSSNYDTDIFMPIFAAIRVVTGAPPYRGTLSPPSPERGRGVSAGSAGPSSPAGQRRGPAGAATADPQIMVDVSYRVIADHVRCLTFALTDGAVPDREGRGYVLRRILRRAVRYGWQYLDTHEPFLHRLVPAVVDAMGDAFPELKQNPQAVMDLIREEEESFDRTLERGIALFEEAADFARKRHHGEIRGEDAFKLHDTYGFPIDLTQIMAAEQGLRVDIGEYERLMEAARERARQGTKLDADFLAAFPPERFRQHGGVTNDIPKYDRVQIRARITALAIREEGEYALHKLTSTTGERIKSGKYAGVVCDRTCFYSEAGGQVGDRGQILGQSLRFNVDRTQRIGDAIVHVGTVVQGELAVGDEVELAVDRHRASTMKNHTATHVMNWALRDVLDPEGKHLQQKGSLVDPEKTRFDFSHPRPLTPEEIERVEQLANERIRENLPVHADFQPIEKARRIHGLRAVFGEKYPDSVRIVCCGVPVEQLVANPENANWQRYPIEFCGGTHVKNTSEIQRFVIATEEAVAKGIRRIVAITGVAAEAAEALGTDLLKRAEKLCRVGIAHQECRVGTAHEERGGGAAHHPPDDFAAQVADLQKAVADATIPLRHRLKLRDMLGELQQMLRKQQKTEAADALGVVNARVDELLAAAEKIGDTTIVIGEMPDVPIEQLKQGADRIKQKCKSAAILFGVWADRPTEPAGHPRGPSSEPEAQARDPSTEPEAQARGRLGTTAVPAAGSPLLAEQWHTAEPSRDREGAVSAGPPSPAPAGGKALLLAAMTDDLVKRGLKAGDLVKAIAPIVGGGGGGPPTMAQAGGKNPQKLGEALEAGRRWIADRL